MWTKKSTISRPIDNGDVSSRSSLVVRRYKSVARERKYLDISIIPRTNRNFMTRPHYSIRWNRDRQKSESLFTQNHLTDDRRRSSLSVYKRWRAMQHILTRAAAPEAICKMSLADSAILRDVSVSFTARTVFYDCSHFAVAQSTARRSRYISCRCCSKVIEVTRYGLHP